MAREPRLRQPKDPPPPPEGPFRTGTVSPSRDLGPLLPQCGGPKMVRVMRPVFVFCFVILFEDPQDRGGYAPPPPSFAGANSRGTGPKIVQTSLV